MQRLRSDRTPGTDSLTARRLHGCCVSGRSDARERSTNAMGCGAGGRARCLATIESVLGLAALKDWTLRRWLFAAAMTVVSALAIGLPTDVIPNPVFGRQGTPVEPWAVPVLALTAVLSGLLIATYLRPDASAAPDSIEELDGLDRPSRFGGIGGLLSFFAIGCPICNKVVVVALGTSGALSWFAPIQPYLGIVALALLAWALRVRLRGEIACSIDPTPLSTGHASRQAAP